MSLVFEYSTLKEKAEFFINGETPITVNIDGIFKKLDEFAGTGDFIFRGSSEAKYKLYNAAQRLYIGSELYRQVSPDDSANHYNEFINDLIEESKRWENDTLRKLLIQNKIHENNSLAYLSYMQHYGIPTPFLDFTFDPYIALFFAVNGIIHNPSNNEIDNYFSVYYTYQNTTAFESWKASSQNLIPNHNSGNIPYTELNQLSMHIILPDNEAYQILNSTNIINQKGLFLYNNSAFHPLEKTYSEFILGVKKDLGDKMFDELLLIKNFAGCFNIHKSLAPYIKEVLTAKGITKEYLFPDTYQMKSAVINNAIIRALSTNK